MSEWQTLALEDCMEAIIDYRGKSPNKTTFGVPLITAKVVKGGRIETPDEFIAETDYDDWMSRGIPQAGDVVMTTEAPLGEVAQLDGRKVALAQRIITLRGKPGVLDQNFLKFLLQSQSVQEELRSRATGTTVVGIRQSELRKVNLTLPSYEAQKYIGHILGSLDDKIEMNRRMNETLEAMARAIFQSWFVDFDPVRAKASGEPTESICQRLGLTPELLALFPDSFEDSELGEIPQGWYPTRLDDVLELAYGKALKAADRVEGPFPVYGSGGVTGFHNESLVDGPTVIVGRKGTVGSLYWEDGASFPIDTVFYVKPKAQLTYCYYLLQTLGLEDMNTDAAVPGLNRNNAYRLFTSFPCGELREAFDNIAMSIRRQIFSNSEQSENLSKIRDTLLPKLLSGELEIQEIDD
ncbi:restriction endonuclease subunit S [Uliginosibacterium sp. TH139]|nr:restriction endonuclease subunit S [Uliginosibacterium sp. TH139]